MSNVIPFKPPSRKQKAAQKTLCKNGFHKWKVNQKKQFDSQSGKLVTIFECVRCGKRKTEYL